MRKILWSFLTIMVLVNAETLFEVKDSYNNPVLNVSTDGLRVMNEGDTLMVISADAIRANIGMTQKGLSRSFSVTTTSSVKGKGLINALEVDAGSATMTSLDGKYTDFSPANLFLGLNSGLNTVPTGVEEGRNNIFFGNYSGVNNSVGRNNIFIGENSGNANLGGGTDYYFGSPVDTGNNNIYIGTYAGRYNDSGYQNVMIGSYSNMAGKAKRSTFVGRYTGHASEGYDNVFVGTDAGKYNKYGNMNVLVGEGSGYRLGETVVAHYNTFLGDRTGFSNTGGTGNVFLGYNAGYNETGSNKLYISNSNTSTPLIKGTFPNADLTFKATDIYAQGNLSISGDAVVSGTSLKITTNPGTGTTPAYFLYQGTVGSTLKSGAFAVNDALWVSSNAYVDGTLTMKGGTPIGKTQAGSYNAGTNSTGGVKTVTITFPTAFNSVPKVNITPRGQNYTDVFAVTTRNVTTTDVQVNIYRVDSAGGLWAQTLQLDWFAWE
ncbi:MAG: H-type lectin domain-containing protein [Candidatus Delongbacteria bacterium]|jgi:hypothetical protein|nr:H-type lectin domain-containing protein [Candidatus Delongbacteria bacterium]